MSFQTDNFIPILESSSVRANGAAKTTVYHAQFVKWMRSMAPYIHRFNHKTCGVGFGGEIVHQHLLNAFVSDIALLQAIGIQIVLVHGSRS